MKLQIFAVYDHKSQTYGTPFFKTHMGVAIRDFGDAAQDPQTTICRHPEDYQLFNVGEYDDSDASIKNFIPPILVSSASEFKIKPETLDVSKLIAVAKNNTSEKVEVK